MKLDILLPPFLLLLTGLLSTWIFSTTRHKRLEELKLMIEINNLTKENPKNNDRSDLLHEHFEAEIHDYMWSKKHWWIFAIFIIIIQIPLLLLTIYTTQIFFNNELLSSVIVIVAGALIFLFYSIYMKSLGPLPRKKVNQQLEQWSTDMKNRKTK